MTSITHFNITSEARVSNIPNVIDALDPPGFDNGESWSKVSRLALLSTLAAIGSVGNIFLISTILMKKPLKRRGNSFIVNVALADLLITGFAIPSSIIALLSGLLDWRPICRIQWTLTMTSSFVVAPSMGMLGLEERLYFGVPVDRYRSILTPCKIATVIVATWLTGGASVATMLILKQLPDVCLDVDYEANVPLGWKWHMPASLAALFILLPLILGLLFGISTLFRARSEKALSPLHRFPKPNFDSAIVQTNLVVLMVYGATHTPLAVALGFNTRQEVPYSSYNHLLWLAMSKAVLNPLIYASCHRHCRETFISLFEYCCCKTSVNFSRRVRQETLRPASEVRVHIIPGYNMYSTVAQNSRGATTNVSTDYNKVMIQRHTANTKSVPKPKSKTRNPSKQIYEL